MRARASFALATTCSLLFLANMGWSQVDIDQLDQPDDQHPWADTPDAGSRDAGHEAGDTGLIIERGSGWGALQNNVSSADPRARAFEALAAVLTTCLAETADPREADVFVQYELTAAGDRIDAKLLELVSNPEIHIDQYSLRVATPIPPGGALWTKPQAKRFRSCVHSFAFRKPDGTDDGSVFCMSGRARFGAADLLIDSRTFSDSSCASDPPTKKSK